MDTRTPQDTTAPYPEAADDLALRAVLACARRRNDARHAERALLQATEDLTLCSFVAWEKQRSEGTTAERLFVELQHTRFLLREAREHAEAVRVEQGPRVAGGCVAVAGAAAEHDQAVGRGVVAGARVPERPRPRAGDDQALPLRRAAGAAALGSQCPCPVIRCAESEAMA